jgi:nucleoid-associated protein YgaU
MKYKTFIWPNNPTNISIGYEKRIIKHEYPDIDGAEFEELGAEPRNISGSGVFFGNNAYNNFKKLQKLFYEKTDGKLYHPKYGTFTVRFTKLTSKEEPLPNYVEYDFEFVENKDISIFSKPSTSASSSTSNSSNSNKTRYYTVKNEDSLWKISKKYYGTGTKWKKIADANKKKLNGNPSLIRPGWKLIIPY